MYKLANKVYNNLTLEELNQYNTTAFISLSEHIEDSITDELIKDFVINTLIINEIVNNFRDKKLENCMSKITKGILIALAYIIGTLYLNIASLLEQSIIYFIGCIVIYIVIYKVLKLSLQFVTKGLNLK